MILLEWYKPSTWLSGAADGIMGAILNGLRTIFYNIMTIVFELIVNVYNLFDKLCGARILGEGILGEMATRVGFLLGIIMFFYVIFSFVQMLIDPDKVSDKEKGAVATFKRTILVIVMLGVSNFFFETLYDVQEAIMDSDVISKIILPYTIEEEQKDNFGNLLSVTLMESFYNMDPRAKSFLNEDGSIMGSDESYNYIKECNNKYIPALKNQIYYDNRYDLGYACLNQSINLTDNQGNDDQIYIINYNGIIATLAGGFVVYILLMYCFKVGVRMIQLAFLEIISPMAIISYMSPKKDNMFTKWWKIYFATYIDVFIRVAIINFVVFLICTIFTTNDMEGNFMFWETLDYVSEGERVFFMLVIILALLTFGKKAPDLLKELLPAGASKLGFGLGMKDIVGLKEGLGMVAGAATGAAIGLIGGVAGKSFGGAVKGLIGGTFRGGKAGLEAKSLGKAMTSAREKQAKVNLDRAQAKLAGARWYDNIGAGFNKYVGNIGEYETLEAEVSSYGDLKSDIEGEDIVKDASSTLDIAYQEYYRNATPGTAMSKTEWLEGGTPALNPNDLLTDATGAYVMEDGKYVNKHKRRLDDAKQAAYADLYSKSDSAFHAKVDMHNRRFGTKYGAGTSWKSINDTRKSKSAKLETQRARKPKK